MSIVAVSEDAHETPPHLSHLSSVREPGPADRARAAGTTAASRRTVLIVEDEPALRESLCEILRLQGYETAEAENGEVALQILGERDIDVLILDLHLPKLDGVTLLQRIDPPPPMVIIHSAFEFFSPEDVRRRTGSKVFRMVRKPIPPPQLLAAVAAAVTELDDPGE